MKENRQLFITCVCLLCTLSLSCIWLFATPQPVACQAPLARILQARILEWVAMPSSRESSQPRDWTQFSCIAGRFFTIRVTGEFFKLHLGETFCVISRVLLLLRISFLQVNIFHSISLPSCRKGIVYLSDLMGVGYYILKKKKTHKKLDKSGLTQRQESFWNCMGWVMLTISQTYQEIFLYLSKKSIYLMTLKLNSVQSLNSVWLFATPWITAHQASLSNTNSRSSHKLMSIESVMPSSHLILCCPLLLPPIPPSIRVFSNESTLCMRWPKYWSFSFSISPSKKHPGLISFRMDWLDLLAVQGTLKSLLQHHSSKASILLHSAFC